MATSVSSTGSTTTTTTAASSSSSNSAAIGSQLATALGGGTGIDMAALATNLAQAEFSGRLGNIDDQSSKLTTEISQTSQLKSDLLALSTSLGNIVRGGSLAATPSVADGTVASAGLPVGSSGASGSYSLEVLNLASPQVLNSASYASAGATTGSGTLTINFGQVSGSTFTADTTRSPVNIAVAQGATLGDVANAINAAGAGITAYVAQGSSGASLVLKGQSGASQGFTLSATESASDPGLSVLAWEPATGAAARLAASAGDARYRLDGIERTASSNKIANAAPGLSLSLTGTNAGHPTTISYSDPTTGIGSAMQDLTSALNGLVTEMNDSLNAANGGLAQDPATRAAKAKLLQLTSATIMPNAAPGDPRTLADLGLSINKDGGFVLDSAKLTTLLAANPTGAAAMFTTGLYGVYGTVDALTRGLTSTNDASSLGSALAKYAKLQTTLADQRAALVAQQDKVRTRLIDQFAGANALVAGAKSTLSYLQNQIAAWNHSGN